MLAPSTEDSRAFYKVALCALRLVEARRPTNRRFGAEADARWVGFRGDLATADRLDLLLRDADAEWPGAFGARVAFAGRAVAEDDAFGPAWSPLEPMEAEELWRRALATDGPRDLDDLLSAWTEAWGTPLTAFATDAVSTADRFVVAGPSAIAATLRAFVGRMDLAWREQVTVVATPPAHRQLAALASAVLHTTQPTNLCTHGQAHALVGRVLVSGDATPEDAAAARSAAG